MHILFFILAGLSLVGGGYLLIRQLRRFYKNHRQKSLEKNDLIFLGAGLGLIGASGAFLQAGIDMANAWPMSGGEATMAIIGQGGFFLSFVLLWVCFFLRYYKADFDPKQRKMATIVLFVCIAASLAFFLLCGEGVANYLTYPLVSGILINKEGLSTVTSQTDPHTISGIHIAWYGVVILGGALVSYFICDHRFYKVYHKHGILETCLIFALAGGILGARIWYVVGNWTRDGFDAAFYTTNAMGEKTFDFWAGFVNIIAIWKGGLTILGGAVGGMIAGWIFVRVRRKYVDILFAADTIVPTILIAQAIGRWGNFFNSEVYGANVAISDGWQWLPTWIKWQMPWLNVSDPARIANDPHTWSLAAGYIHVPLFLIEGIINIAGYFVIAWLIPKLIWKEKYRPGGCLLGLYLIWYGGSRMILEMFRNTSFNMGENNYWSFWNAMIYIILGLVWIGAMFAWKYWLGPIYASKKAAKAAAAETAEEAVEPAEEIAEPSSEEEPKEEADKTE